jgi:hypothetical protein
MAITMMVSTLSCFTINEFINSDAYVKSMEKMMAVHPKISHRMCFSFMLSGDLTAVCLFETEVAFTGCALIMFVNTVASDIIMIFKGYIMGLNKI